MPYIKQTDRQLMDKKINELCQLFQRSELGEGHLNYAITKLIMAFFRMRSGYAAIASVIGVLENVKQEFYRRVVAPYEDIKMKANGDVY